MMIKLSIVIPLFNKEKQILRTLDSVLGQSYTNFEVVVVNDGSTDNSGILVESIKDKRIRLLNKPNGGVSSARNFGIKAARNEWIVLLDADDLLLQDALQMMVEMIEKYPKERYFSGRTLWAGEKIRKDRIVYIRKTYMPFFFIWLGKIDPAPRNVVIHRDLFERFGYYDERQSFFEDWDVSIRLAQYGCMVYTNFYLAKYTPNENGLSQSSHPITKEMAYYIPEFGIVGFWYKALLFENLRMTMSLWEGHSEEYIYYKQVEQEYFDWRFRTLHWLHQKMKRWNIL